MSPQDFRPTPAMQLYAFQRAKLGVKASERVISKKIGVAPETISRWKNINGFKEWLEDQLIYLRSPIHERLEAAAMSRLHDFKFWCEMAKKHGFIEKPDDGFDFI